MSERFFQSKAEPRRRKLDNKALGNAEQTEVPRRQREEAKAKVFSLTVGVGADALMAANLWDE